MSTRGGRGRAYTGGASGSGSNSSSKGKNVPEYTGSAVEQLSHGVADVSLDIAQDEGPWEVISKKSRNRGGTNAPKSWGSQNFNPRTCGHPDVAQKPGMQNSGGSIKMPGNVQSTQPVDRWRSAGRGNARPLPSNRVMDSYNASPQPVIRPPLEHGWNWQARVGANESSGSGDGQKRDDYVEVEEDNDDVEEDNDDEDDDFDDSDDELLSDDFDSDSSQKSHETRKKNRWFKQCFQILDGLTVEEINEPTRQWHCPACHGGPGAIDWYRGLQPLITHAKTKGSKRVRLHRELAELLEEELHRRGTSVIPAGEQFGKWKGLKDEERDHEIIWPPMVIVMNTRLEKDENDKWTGMGNQELLEYFSSYAAARARHSYGPQGHRGMSVLIFESSARGYLEAERLHKHFAEQGMDRNAWDRRRVLFHSGGKRQLYGFMAVKEDLDLFNQHSQGKSRLKYEMKSYHEMVVRQIRQMTEDNQQLIYLKNKVVKEQRHSKALEESFGIVSEKLRKTMEENRIVRLRTQMHHEQNKEELDFLEQIFKNQLKIMREERIAKEEDFEKLQQEKREHVKHLDANPSSTEEYRRRVEEIANFIELQDKEMGDFVSEREGLIKSHENKMAEIAAKKQKLWEEEVESEKEFDTQLTSLMKKYSQSSVNC